MELGDIDTPALLIDLDAYERNLERMADKVQATTVRLRPHAKTHKCPIIARHQMVLGAIGQCCQKVGEAEAMVRGGVPDVLVSNEVVGKSKIRRLAALARLARIGVCVDNQQVVADTDEAAQTFGTRLDVLIEIDVGTQRCGVSAGEDARNLAQMVDRCTGLRLGGIQAYHGSAQHIRSYETRRRAIEQCAQKAQHTRDLFERAGLNCEIVSGAGTGTHPFDIASGVYNELQVGSYIFMDADYLKNLGADGKPIRDFEPSLFVLTSVMSHPVADRAVVDAGLKALSTDCGLPTVWQHEHMAYVSVSDEHGVVKLDPARDSIAVGDKLSLLPGHCDPTVNLHDWYVAMRGGSVEGIWPITARGAGR